MNVYNKLDKTNFKIDISINKYEDNSDYNESKNNSEYIQEDLSEDKIIYNKFVINSENNISNLDEDSIKINNIKIN